MMSERDQFCEWLTRVADEVNQLRRKPRLGTEKKLAAIRANYDVISVLIKVANRQAYMIGVPPLNK